MEKFQKILGQWNKLITKYDKDSKKFQQQIAEIIKIEWTTSKSRSESDMKIIIDKSGNLSVNTRN